MSTHEGHKENEFSTKIIVVFTILVGMFRVQIPLLLHLRISEWHLSEYEISHQDIYYYSLPSYL
jgi:hypothetical protein